MLKVGLIEFSLVTLFSFEHQAFQRLDSKHFPSQLVNVPLAIPLVFEKAYIMRGAFLSCMGLVKNHVFFAEVLE